MRSLFLLPTMREEIDILLRLNPRSARTHNLAGNFMAEVPVLLGGDKQKAEEHLKKALEIDPRYTTARLSLANFLAAAGRDAEARRELRRILAETAPTSPADWHASHVPRARQLLERLGDER
jgi:tetratricopeptide (TPR) repeat protein